MSKSRISEVDRMLADHCHAISNPRRNLIIRILGDGEHTVSELVELTGFSCSNISQHLKILRDRRIVAVNRNGAFASYRLAQPGLLEAVSALRNAMIESLRQSGALLSDDEQDAAVAGAEEPS